MLANFKRNYLRLVRKAYRYLRSKKLREITWLQALIKPVFNRELWHPYRTTVARGLSIGLFTAMLPVPFQMVIAAIGSIRFKGNIPTAIASCWVTNPLTMIPLFIMQEKLGGFLSPLVMFWVEPFLENAFLQQPFLERSMNFGIGFLTCAVILATLAFPVVWVISAVLPRMIPKHRPLIRKRKSVKPASFTK